MKTPPIKVPSLAARRGMTKLKVSTDNSTTKIMSSIVSLKLDRLLNQLDCDEETLARKGESNYYYDSEIKVPGSPLLPIRDFTIDLPDYLENCCTTFSYEE
jgi:hypothetical protein